MAADPKTLRLGCRCGRLQLRLDAITPAVANRVACHCRGCTQFAHDMCPDILDAWGGTQRLQVSPARVSIVAGHDALACRQQTRKGALRWYASCCDTPLGLTLSHAKVPFVGLDAHALDLGETPLHSVLGPLRARVNLSPRPDNAKELKADSAALFAMLRHLVPLTWRWWWRGDQHRSPFFDAKGNPVVDVDRRFARVLALQKTAGCR
ncbi:MAG: DUF6151 family protein [Nannocystales bacterium]